MRRNDKITLTHGRCVNTFAQNDSNMTATLALNGVEKRQQTIVHKLSWTMRRCCCAVHKWLGEMETELRVYGVSILLWEMEGMWWWETLCCGTSTGITPVWPHSPAPKMGPFSPKKLPNLSKIQCKRPYSNKTLVSWQAFWKCFDNVRN